MKEGQVKVDVCIETEKRLLTVSTPSNPSGEIIELPDSGFFVPAILNKTAKSD